MPQCKGKCKIDLIVEIINIDYSDFVKKYILGVIKMNTKKLKLIAGLLSISMLTASITPSVTALAAEKNSNNSNN